MFAYDDDSLSRAAVYIGPARLLRRWNGRRRHTSSACTASISDLILTSAAWKAALSGFAKTGVGVIRSSVPPALGVGEEGTLPVSSFSGVVQPSEIGDPDSCL